MFNFEENIIKGKTIINAMCKYKFFTIGSFFVTLSSIGFCFVAFVNNLNAQLVAGDIAFVQYNADGTDNFPTRFQIFQVSRALMR